MLKLDFNINHQRVLWDEFKTFYIRGGRAYKDQIVQFHTGEAICTTSYERDPDHRGLIKEFNVGIYATSDGNMPLLMTSDGEQVKPSWLDENGYQLVLVDHCTGHVVKLQGYYSKDDPGSEWRAGMPLWLRDRPRTVTAYFPGPGEPPIGAPVVVNRPTRPTKEEQAHVNDLRVQVRAWAAIGEVSQAPTWGQAGSVAVSRTMTKYEMVVPINGINVGVEQKPFQITELMNKTFAMMTDGERWRLWMYGTNWTSVRQTHPYLLVRKAKSVDTLMQIEEGANLT